MSRNHRADVDRDGYLALALLALVIAAVIAIRGWGDDMPSTVPEPAGVVNPWGAP